MEITPDLITQYGLMSKISTGHSLVDVMLCLLVPILIRQLLPRLLELGSSLMAGRKKEEKTFSRHVEHTVRSSYYWWNDDTPSNTILQRALINYINTKVDILAALPNAELQIKKRTKAELLAMAAAKSGNSSSSGTPSKADGLNGILPTPVVSVDEDDEEAANLCTDHAYAVNLCPPSGEWIDLKNGIRFMRNQESLDEKQKNTKTTFFLESKDKDGDAKIQAFIEEALELYRQQQSAVQKDPSRYLYMPVLTGWLARASGGEGENKPNAVYKRYKLSEEKTFKAFFHPDKDSIVSLVDAFQHKRGKFAIPGYPQKLGFLLYGPPGTGKTSFIKALAQYTRRSIISIPLTKISTNQELMDIMFDQKIQVENMDGGIELPYSKTIFVMEDVDAASSVVQRRVTTTTSVELVASEAASQIKMCRATSMEPVPAPSASHAHASGSHDALATITSDEDEGDDNKDDSEEGSKGKGKSKAKAFGPTLPMFGKSMFGDDALNLAGLLNVLDGVVDTPNRIIIMTTNHPEKLDPALIRPGRINKKVFMGRMRAAQALEMLRHYFGEVSEAVAARLRASFVDEVLSPADLETMCADHDTPEELCAQLEARFHSMMHHKSA